MENRVLWLRTVGGLGNRLLPLLMSLDAVERSGHSIFLNWPTKYNERTSHSVRESNFPHSISRLYDFDVNLIGEQTWRARTREDLPYYGLKHTQLGKPALQDPDSRQVPLQEHKETHVVVEAHGWLNVDGMGWEILGRLRDVYLKYFKLHEREQELFEETRAKFAGRPVVGVYMRQLHRALKKWDAYGRITPEMRKHRDENPDTLFFVISECPDTVNSIRSEFGSDNVVTTPKPGIMNHPEEMLGVVVDIELMRHVDVYYPTWGSGLARLMSALRKDEIL